MLEAVESGFLGLVSDQYAGKKGVHIEFFGRETSTPAGAAAFHLKSAAPVFFITCILQPNLTYAIGVKEMTFPDLPADKTRAITMINKVYNGELEAAIRRNPEQYFWFHRKWRN